jgi:uncharacterized protein involved in exopolysaccharide biosynthesis
MNAPNDSPIRLWTMADIAAALQRQSKVLAICFVALAAGVVTAVLTAAPFYEGKLKILVKRDRADSVISGAAAASSAGNEQDLSETEVMSQVELIKSDELLAKVAAETGLATQIRSRHPDLTEAEAIEEAAGRIRERLTVAPVKRTWLIDVGYESEERSTTRQVLDTLVRLYFEKHLTLQRPAGSFQFFADQAERARQDLEAAQAKLAAFSTQHQVVSAATEKQSMLQKLSEFDAMRAQAAAQLAETSRRLTVVNNELQRVPERRTSAVRTDVGVIRDATSRIVTLEMQRAELLQKFTPQYRGVKEIDAQLQQARAALAAAEQSPVMEQTIGDNPTRQWLDTERARTSAEHAAIRARVQALSSTVGQYRAQAQALDIRDAEQQDLERQLKTAEAKYLLYVQKQEEARISDELDRTRIANVVVAEGPAVAYEPQRDPSLAYLPLLLGAALLFSGGVALAVDALAPAYRRWRATSASRTPIIGHASPSEGPLS